MSKISATAMLMEPPKQSYYGVKIRGLTHRYHAIGILLFHLIPVMSGGLSITCVRVAGGTP